MDYHSFLTSMSKLGATIEDICLNTLGIGMDKINENVIIYQGGFLKIFCLWRWCK